MSEGRVLISTHDLPIAGELRTRFEEVGYETDFVTPTERITGSNVPTVLVVTGRDGSGTSALAEHAKEELYLPVFAVEDVADLAPRLGCFDEVFNAALIGGLAGAAAGIGVVALLELLKESTKEK